MCIHGWSHAVDSTAEIKNSRCPVQSSNYCWDLGFNLTVIYSVRDVYQNGQVRRYCSTWSPGACAIQTDNTHASDPAWDLDANYQRDCKCQPGCGICPCLARAMGSLQRTSLYKVLHGTTPCQLRPLFSSSVVENQSASGGVECPTDEQNQEKIQLGGNGNASAPTLIDGKTTPSHIYRWRRISFQQVLGRLTSKERESLMISPTLELANSSWELNRNEFAPSCYTGENTVSKDVRCCGLAPYLQVWDGPTHTASDVIETLKLHNMSNMVFLGDSVGLQYFVALMTMLERSGMNCEDNYTKSDLFKERWWALIPAEQRDLHKSIMKWSYCYFCDGFVIFVIRQQPIEYIGTKDDFLRVVTKYWSGVADVISFNHGLHINYPSEMAKMLDVTLPHLNEFGSKPGKLVIYRETSAQHFSGGTGSYESRDPDAKHCAMHIDDAHPGYRNMLLYRAVKEKFHGIHVEGLWRVSAARHDMHLEANLKGVTDCTHFCHNPFFWEGVFSNLYDELQSVFLKDGRTHQEISSMIKTYGKIDTF